MKGKIVMLLTVVCVILLASLPKSISAPAYREREAMRRRQEKLIDERDERQREDRKARAESRKERAQEKRQDMLANRKIAELEKRIRQLEYTVMPFMELPAKLINSGDTDLYKSTYEKLRRDACVALVIDNAVRTADVAGVRLKTRKATAQLADEVYRILLERFLERNR